MRSWPEVEAELRAAGYTDEQIARAKWEWFSAFSSSDQDFAKVPVQDQWDLAHRFLVDDGYLSLPQVDRLDLWNKFSNTSMFGGLEPKYRQKARELFTHAPGASDVTAPPVQPQYQPPDTEEESSPFKELGYQLKSGTSMTASSLTDVLGQLVSQLDEDEAQKLYQLADDMAVGAADQVPAPRVPDVRDI